MNRITIRYDGSLEDTIPGMRILFSNRDRFNIRGFYIDDINLDSL